LFPPVPPILCVTGPSGCGKTRLLERLIPGLAAAGIRVGAIKHCGHIEPADPGKDSARLALAGAKPAIAAAPDALRAQPLGYEPFAVDLAAMFCAECDMVLVEGYSGSIHDKIAFPGRSGPDATEGARLVLDKRKADVLSGEEPLTEWILDWLARRRSRRSALVGIVLTGGASRRMGADKSELRVGGRRVLGRLCELLADRLGRVMIVGRRPAPDGVPRCAEWHPDRTPGLGPLGGIATALEIASAIEPGAGVLALACDMPAVRGPLLDELLDHRRRDAPATVIPNPERGSVEPFPGIYESSGLSDMRDYLAGGERSVRSWLDRAGAHSFPLSSELVPQLANVNTPEDLTAIETDGQAG